MIFETASVGTQKEKQNWKLYIDRNSSFKKLLQEESLQNWSMEKVDEKARALAKTQRSF